MQVAAAGVNGVSAAYAQLRRLTREQALAEIADLIGRLPAEHRQAALDHAAAGYIDADSLDTSWHQRAYGLLIEAGTDETAARAIRETRRGGNLTRGI